MTPVNPAIVDQIKEILSQSILEGTLPEQLKDVDLASLDSIGRLSLLVELENVFIAELMGENLESEAFESFDRLAAYVVRQRDAAVAV